MSQYFYSDENFNACGPFSPDELAQKGITDDTLIWQEGMEDWVPARHVKPVKAALDAAAAAEPEVPAADTPFSEPAPASDGIPLSDLLAQPLSAPLTPEPQGFDAPPPIPTAIPSPTPPPAGPVQTGGKKNYGGCAALFGLMALLILGLVLFAAYQNGAFDSHHPAPSLYEDDDYEAADSVAVDDDEWAAAEEATEAPAEAPAPSDHRARSANIRRIWVDHNVYEDGVKGMRIHAKIDVENLEGRTVYVYAYFYQGDNVTPLHDQYGGNLTFYNTGNVGATHTSGTFEDLSIFVPFSGLNMAPGTSGTFSFDLAVKYDGDQLARENNTTFTYSNVN